VQVFKIYRKLREGVAYIAGGPIVASVELMFPPPPSTYVLWERGGKSRLLPHGYLSRQSHLQACVSGRCDVPGHVSVQIPASPYGT
jgi:hypothetical protein